MTTPAEELARLQQSIDRCDPEALLDLLDARRERTIRRLRHAVAELRATTEATAAAHERLADHLRKAQRMTTTTEYRKLTQAQLVAEATERFGTDPLKWAFTCPSCGDIANGHDFKEALAANPRTHKTGDTVIASDVVGQECIGRTLGALSRGKYTGRGCNWAAYGLFAGPWEIELPNGRTMHAFPLAPAPC